MTGKSSEHDPKGYRDRTYGEGGGYGQGGPSLSDEGGIPKAKPRQPLGEGGAGGHIGEYEAEHWRGRSEREPGEEGAGRGERFSEDGFDPHRVEAALSGEDQGEAPGARPDKAILKDVESLLEDDDTLDATAIELNVSGGTVILLGDVDSEEAKNRAEDMARSVKGAAEVRNQLTVQSDRLGTTPPVRH